MSNGPSGQTAAFNFLGTGNFTINLSQGTTYTLRGIQYKRIRLGSFSSTAYHSLSIEGVPEGVTVSHEVVGLDLYLYVRTNTPNGRYSTLRVDYIRSGDADYTRRGFTLAVSGSASVPTARAGSWSPGYTSQSTRWVTTYSTSVQRSVTLRAASGGTGNISYTVRGGATTRLFFSNIHRTSTLLRVNQFTPVGNYSLTIRATWTSGATTAHLDRTVYVRVNAATPAAVVGSWTPGYSSASTARQVTQSSSAQTVTLPAATGGVGTISYFRFSGSPSITSRGRVLTVRGGTAVGVYSVTVIARWTSGSSTNQLSRTVYIRVNARIPNAARGSFSVSSITVNTAFSSRTSTISQATGGTGTISYSLQSTRSGITLSGRNLRVSTSVPAGSYRVTVRATWTSGTTTAFRDATFTVFVQKVAAGSVSVANVNLTLSSVSSGSATLNITRSGGVGTVSYALRNAPSGFSLSGTSLFVGGGVSAGTRTLTLRATWRDAAGNTATRDANFRVTITRTSRATAGTLSISNKTVNVTSTTPATFEIEQASGGSGTLSYRLLAAPAGVTFSGRTVTIGTTVGANNALSLSVQATWTSSENTANVTATFTVKITRIARGNFSVSSKTLNLGEVDAGSFNVEEATGGEGTVTYSLVSPPEGVSLTGRAVNIAGTVAAGMLNLTVRATWTDAIGTTATRDSSFGVTITRPAAGDFDVTNQQVTLLTTGTTTLTMPAATGGTGVVSYALVSPPIGVTLSARTLSIGANAPAGRHNISIRATWTTVGGTASTTATFELNIERFASIAKAGAFTIATKTVPTTRTGTASVEFEAATGGVGAITYALVSPPAGITLRGRTILIGGAVAAAAINITVKATWTVGPTTDTLDASFTLNLTRDLPDPVAGTFAVGDKSVTVTSTAGATFLIEAATGGVGTITYTLVTPPVGFSLNNRTVSVESGVQAGVIPLRARATWASGGEVATADAAFNVTVTRTRSARPGQFEIPLIAHRALTPTTLIPLPLPRGGEGTLSYSLVSAPSGVQLELIDGDPVLHVAPSVPEGEHAISVQALWSTDENAVEVVARSTFTLTRGLPPKLRYARMLDNEQLRKLEHNYVFSLPDFVSYTDNLALVVAGYYENGTAAFYEHYSRNSGAAFFYRDNGTAQVTLSDELQDRLIQLGLQNERSYAMIYFAEAPEVELVEPTFPVRNAPTESLSAEFKRLDLQDERVSLDKGAANQILSGDQFTKGTIPLDKFIEDLIADTARFAPRGVVTRHLPDGGVFVNKLADPLHPFTKESQSAYDLRVVNTLPVGEKVSVVRTAEGLTAVRAGPENVAVGYMRTPNTVARIGGSFIIVNGVKRRI